MPTDPLSPQPPPLARRYKDVYLDQLKKQAVRASLATLLISYIFTVIFLLRIISLKGLLWTFVQQNVVIVAVSSTACLIVLGFIRGTQTSVWRPKYLCEGTELLAAFRNPDYYITTLAYGLAGIAMMELYFSTLLEEPYTSTWFVYPPGHRAYAKELNMERLFITLYGCLLGIGYALKSIVGERNVLRIPPVQEPKAWALKVTMSTLVHWSWKYAGKALVISYVVFIAFSSFIYYMVAPWIGIFWSHLLASPVQGFRWYDLYLILRMLMAGSFMTFEWQMADRVFDVFFAVTPDVSRTSPQPNQCLLDGLRNNNDEQRTVIKSMAYGELAKIATKEPKRRSDLFLDTNDTFTVSAWKSISDECIATLAGLRSRLDNEYSADKKKKKYDPFDSMQPVPRHQQHSESTIRRVVLLDTDILARDEDRHGQQPPLDDRTPGLFLSDPSMVLDQGRYTPSDTTTTTLAQSDDKYAMLPRMLVKDGWQRVKQIKLIKALSNVTIDQKTRALFSNFPDLIHAIQALGGLTASSLNEDPYGYVQHDIAKVLDALVGTLVDVEHFIQSPPQSYRSLPRLLDDPGVWTEPNSVIRALHDSIYEIVLTFKDYMDHVKYRVEKKYQARLVGFL